MIEEAKAFWDAIAGKVKNLIRRETENALRVQRYEVTTAPNGSVMGVTQPFGNNELFLPYSQEVAGAAVGDTVLVAWWGSMSNARVYYFAKGYDGAGKVSSVNGKTGAVTLTAADVGALPDTYKALHLEVAAFSSLPQTISNAAITADMRVVECTWGTPGAITSDVTWTTGSGSLVLSGTMSGSTTADIILIKTN